MFIGLARDSVSVLIDFPLHQVQQPFIAACLFLSYRQILSSPQKSQLFLPT